MSDYISEAVNLFLERFDHLIQALEEIADELKEANRKK
jgi:hypothetical protein